MNRKGAKEQNDISIIIGNLPKRLQKKIAEEVVGTSLPVDNSINGGERETPTRTTFLTNGNDSNDGDGSSGVGGGDGGGTVPLNIRALQRDCNKSITSAGNDVPIDFFLRKASENDDTKSVVVAPKNVTRAEQSTVPKIADGSPSIPGILRLNGIDAKKLNADETPSKKATSNREYSRRQQRAGNVNDNKLLIQSPVHQLQRSAKQPEWFDSVDVNYAQDLKQSYDALLILMQQHKLVENWQKFSVIRQQLQQIFTQLLLHQLKFCFEQKVDNFFWKLLYYNVREQLRQQQNVNCIRSLLDDGLRFYADLHARFTAKYLVAQRQTHKYELVATMMAQKLLICLGDLSRYKVQQLQLNDYTEASKYYRQAQVLLPTNGIPYNQLAIVAVQGRKKFDAVYYHMRSLMSSNAITSAKESLMVLFDDIRKKYEETELKVSPVHINSKMNDGNNSKSMRTEVWIYPDGVRRLHRSQTRGNKISLSNENRLIALTDDELLRRFISLYLYVIGKLYTGIGMESIQEHQRKLLVHLECTLKRNTLILSRNRLLKMLALNIFILQQNMQEVSRREMRYHAFNFCNQFFGLVLRKCNQLMSLYLDDTNRAEAQSFNDLNTLLQFIKIYTDFLSQNLHIWEPARNEEHAFIDCWSELQQFFPLLKRLPIKNRKTFDAVVILEEDIFFLGFTPLLTNDKSNNKCLMTASSQDVQFTQRIARICEFQACYNEQRKNVEMPEESPFILEPWNDAFKNALDCFENAQEQCENNENIVSNGDNRAQSNAELKMSLAGGNVEDAQLTHLSKLKKELEAKSNVNKLYKEKLQEILKYVDTKVYLEVRPKYLLPDTNCFIDYLEDLERLIKEFNRYTLVIPLTVVKELDGLSKGVKLELYERRLQKHRIHHFDDVSTRAQKSLDFIKTTKNNVKCATSKGSIINASLFALVEEEHLSNDDKILATALALSKSMSNETCKDGRCFIQTELVLITTDRNLRVKALTRNLAVSELCEFLQWAKDSSDT